MSTKEDFELLKYLKKSCGAMFVEIHKQKIWSSRSTLSKHLKCMVKEGLITISVTIPPKGRQQTKYAPTAKGKKALLSYLKIQGLKEPYMQGLGEAF